MIKKLSEDEINTLAEDIYRERVFTSDHIRKEDLGMLRTIFLPLALADREMIGELINDTPGLIYEHLSQAGDRSVNGYPTFFSIHVINQEDTKKVWEKVEQIKKSVSEVLTT